MCWPVPEGVAGRWAGVLGRRRTVYEGRDGGYEEEGKDRSVEDGGVMNDETVGGEQGLKGLEGWMAGQIE